MNNHKIMLYKIFGASVLAFAYAVLFSSSVAPASGQTATPLYRFVEYETEFHFYTADPVERAALKKQKGWGEENAAGDVFRKKAPVQRTCSAA